MNQKANTGQQVQQHVQCQKNTWDIFIVFPNQSFNTVDIILNFADTIFGAMYRLRIKSKMVEFEVSDYALFKNILKEIERKNLYEKSENLQNEYFISVQ